MRSRIRCWIIIKERKICSGFKNANLSFPSWFSLRKGLYIGQTIVTCLTRSHTPHAPTSTYNDSIIATFLTATHRPPCWHPRHLPFLECSGTVTLRDRSHIWSYMYFKFKTWFCFVQVASQVTNQFFFSWSFQISLLLKSLEPLRAKLKTEIS